MACALHRFSADCVVLSSLHKMPAHCFFASLRRRQKMFAGHLSSSQPIKDFIALVRASIQISPPSLLGTKLSYEPRKFASQKCLALASKQCYEDSLVQKGSARHLLRTDTAFPFWGMCCVRWSLFIYLQNVFPATHIQWLWAACNIKTWKKNHENRPL